MPLKKKNLPIPSRQRSVGERIVQLLELAALARTVSKVIGRNKRSRVPRKGGLLAIAGGALLAVVIGGLLAKKKSGGSESPAPQSAATPAPAKPEPAKPEPAKPEAEKAEPEAPATPESPTAESAPVQAAVAAAEKLDDVDGVGEGASGPTPAEDEASA